MKARPCGPAHWPWIGILKSGLTSLVFVLALSLASSSVVGTSAVAAEGVPGNALGNQSDSDLWRQVRKGEKFTLSDPRIGTGVLVQSEGEEWRSIRNGPVSTYGGILLLVALGATVLFFLLRGRIKIDKGRSETKIHRFSMAERMIHWFVAALFILLSISGLIILFGRYVLLPVIGQSAFAVVASGAMQGHNLFGPLFIFGIVAMIVVYVKDNFFRAVDAHWLVKAGFMFRGHVSSWKYNLGEKFWFWLVAVTGVALSVSGIFLDFPSLAENLQLLQLANIVHGISAVAVVAAAIGHIYLGTIGVEGALEGMTTGDVDENWAIEHHDLWAEEAMQEQSESTDQGAGISAHGAAKGAAE